MICVLSNFKLFPMLLKCHSWVSVIDLCIGVRKTWRCSRCRKMGSWILWIIFLLGLWCPYCWWFRNPANQLRLVVYPIIYRVLYIPGGAGFLPSTVPPSVLFVKKHQTIIRSAIQWEDHCGNPGIFAPNQDCFKYSFFLLLMAEIRLTTCHLWNPSWKKWRIFSVFNWCRCRISSTYQQYHRQFFEGCLCIFLGVTVSSILREGWWWFDTKFPVCFEFTTG